MDNERSYSEVVERLDEIVETVKSKDASIEKSLDLLEEAVKLGIQAVEMVDLAPPTSQDLNRSNSSR